MATIVWCVLLSIFVLRNGVLFNIKTKQLNFSIKYGDNKAVFKIVNLYWNNDLYLDNNLYYFVFLFILLLNYLYLKLNHIVLILRIK